MLGLGARGAGGELRGAESELELVAEQQLHGGEAEELTARSADGTGFSTRSEDDAELMAPAALRVCAYAACAVLVFGSSVAVNVTCVYIGARELHEPCDKPLAPWLLAQGSLGLVYTALLIVASIPESLQHGSGPRDHTSHRLSPPSFSRGLALGGRHRVVVALLGLMQIVVVVCFCLGSAWVAQSARSDGVCSELLLYWSMSITIATWSLVLLLCAVACVGGLVQHCMHQGDSAGATEREEMTF